MRLFADNRRQFLLFSFHFQNGAYCLYGWIRLDSGHCLCSRTSRNRGFLLVLCLCSGSAPFGIPKTGVAVRRDCFRWFFAWAAYCLVRTEHDLQSKVLFRDRLPCSIRVAVLVALLNDAIFG